MLTGCSGLSALGNTTPFFLTRGAPIYLALDTTPFSVSVSAHDRKRRKKYFSKTYDDTVVKYQAAVHLWRPQLHWASGPYEGAMSDLTIARESGILSSINDNEFVLADKGYELRGGGASHSLQAI